MTVESDGSVVNQLAGRNVSRRTKVRLWFMMISLTTLVVIRIVTEYGVLQRNDNNNIGTPIHDSLGRMPGSSSMQSSNTRQVGNHTGRLMGKFLTKKKKAEVPLSKKTQEATQKPNFLGKFFTSQKARVRPIVEKKTPTDSLNTPERQQKRKFLGKFLTVQKHTSNKDPLVNNESRMEKETPTDSLNTPERQQKRKFLGKFLTVQKHASNKAPLVNNESRMEKEMPTDSLNTPERQQKRKFLGKFLTVQKHTSNKAPEVNNESKMEGSFSAALGETSLSRGKSKSAYNFMQANSNQKKLHGKTLNLMGEQKPRPAPVTKSEYPPFLSRYVSGHQAHPQTNLFIHDQIPPRLLVQPHDPVAIQEMQRTLEHKDAIHVYSPCVAGVCDISTDFVQVFNPWTQDIYFCGKKIEPKNSMKLDALCHDGPRVFSHEPKVRNISLTHPPVEFVFNGDSKRYMTKTDFPCVVPCHQYGSPTPVSQMHVEGTPWRFFYSMESAGYYPWLTKNTSSWIDNTFYATTSFDSDIPLPYFSWAEYNIHTPAVDYDSVIKGASFVASNCASNNHREDVVRDLMTLIQVDSLGKCMRNKSPDTNDKQKMLQKYLFHLAFENSNDVDYITEKCWGSLRSGTLPVYMGAPNILDHVPENSIISWHDFKSNKELGLYLQKVAKNKTLYNSYHEWRKKPLPEKFVQKYEITHTHSSCRLCQWVYAKQRGLGWHHEKQRLRDTQLSRKLCLNADKFVVEPFLESIIEEESNEEHHADPDGKPHCDAADLPTMEMVGPWNRTVWYHDGVTDIILEGSGAKTLYRITTPIKGKIRRLMDGVFQIQNTITRITIAVDAATSLENSSGDQGVFDFKLLESSQEPKRIRVMTEDIDTFHDGADKVMSYYARTMLDEFRNPIVFFKATKSLL